jgi:hypothetical protein
LADFFLVDGRFRVACFMQALLHAQTGALIAVHDFASRPTYHVIYEVAREVASAENFSVFLPRADYDAQHALALLDRYAYESE